MDNSISNTFFEIRNMGEIFDPRLQSNSHVNFIVNIVYQRLSCHTFVYNYGQENSYVLLCNLVDHIQNLFQTNGANSTARLKIIQQWTCLILIFQDYLKCRYLINHSRVNVLNLISSTIFFEILVATRDFQTLLSA